MSCYCILDKIAQDGMHAQKIKLVLGYRNYIFFVNYLNIKRMTQAHGYLLFKVHWRISSRRKNGNKFNITSSINLNVVLKATTNKYYLSYTRIYIYIILFDLNRKYSNKK